MQSHMVIFLHAYVCICTQHILFSDCIQAFVNFLHAFGFADSNTETNSIDFERFMDNTCLICIDLGVLPLQPDVEAVEADQVRGNLKLHVEYSKLPGSTHNVCLPEFSRPPHLL